MDEAKLQEIEARANAATPGPWRSGGFYGLGRVQDGDHAGWVLGGAFPIGRCAFCARAPEPCSATVMHRGEYDAAPRAYHAHWIAAEPGEGWQGISSDAVALAITGNYDYDRGGVRSTPEDSAFIAHARTDVPALVAEVRRLTAALATVTTERDEVCAAMEEREHDMHLRIRAGYDRTIADSWRAEVVRAVAAERDASAARCDALRAEHAAALATARREGAEGMRWEASEAAEQWLREVAEVTEDSPADLADAIRALPLDAPGGGS